MWLYLEELEKTLQSETGKNDVFINKNMIIYLKIRIKKSMMRGCVDDWALKMMVILNKRY